MLRRSTLTGLLVLGAFPAAIAATVDAASGVRPTVHVPRLGRAPRIEAFLAMRPEGVVERTMARVEGLIQQVPEDGQPASQPTVVYLGYDDEALHAVFVAFDEEPHRIRANLGRREDIFGDDIVEIMVDTFHDQRRAYAFITNPLGVQFDAVWTEGNGFDSSFDTVWHSEGRLTDRGYVVWMAIPFKSLRFPETPRQTWGLVLVRDIPRNNESSFWPPVTTRIEGRLNQSADMTGLENISPGRNFQLIPYAAGRSFRAVDRTRSPGPGIARQSADLDAGLDAKLVVRDALVFDATVNPDFSEVESDSPQVTVNRRFEVFFPEKRPFFLENADFFSTPIDLLFTRRIVEPRVGGRLTGKLGRWSVGALLIDDESPPESIGSSPAATGREATFSVLRVGRDVLGQSKIGFLYTDRTLGDGFNRVAAVDARFKLNRRWTTALQAAASRTRDLETPGTRTGGGYDAQLNRAGRELTTHIHYIDFTPEFETRAGFVRRTDLRELHHNVSYRFWPEGPRLVSWGPSLFWMRLDDHEGTRLDRRINPSISWNLRGQTNFGVFWESGRERLRSEDFSSLDQNADFHRDELGVFFDTRFTDAFNADLSLARGSRINFVPPAGQPPAEADVSRATVDLTFRPTARLRNDDLYLLTRLADPRDGGRIFVNHIFRSRWSYQLTRRLTLRAIVQYETTRVNPDRTSLQADRSLNGDLLATYLVNPWTALYVGYTSNYTNERLEEGPAGPTLVRTGDDLVNDARQFFVKFSYLIRP